MAANMDNKNMNSTFIKQIKKIALEFQKTLKKNKDQSIKPKGDTIFNFGKDNITKYSNVIIYQK